MADQRFPKPPPLPAAAKFVGVAFGLIPAGIGITVLVFLWSAPFGGFGSPPVFFRIFGSFIALAFVLVGGLVCSGAVAGTLQAPGTRGVAGGFDRQGQDALGTSPPAYACPQCGAPLAEGTDISPHGDTKCKYCNCWFNVHGK